ncbi:hypothetical protein M0802_010508 [Mischocyttarus mexicanus]|nr:hypothetical protein M0802_010508 [Mischocyttarus mexicanus]
MTDTHEGSTGCSSDAVVDRTMARRSQEAKEIPLTDDMVRKMKYVELKGTAKRLQLSASGTKAEKDSDSETEDESEEEGERKKRSAPSPFSISDVEESLPEFSGDDLVSVKKWTSKFEEVAELLQWNDLQKLIYGKRTLRGSARRFVESENGITSWAMLKKKLASEFINRISSTSIHAQLAERKKRPDETGQEYIYVMKEIAALGRVEERALLEHIISGIVDEEVKKKILYQSRTLKELKRNIEIYDKMKRKSKAIRTVSRSNNEVEKERRPEPTKAKKAYCFSCGSPDHIVKQCSALGKGPKCFRSYSKKFHSFGALSPLFA